MIEPAPLRYSARIREDLWAVLTDLGTGEWQLQLWGDQHLHVRFGGLTTREAMDHAEMIVDSSVSQRAAALSPAAIRWNPVVKSTLATRASVAEASPLRSF